MSDTDLTFEELLAKYPNGLPNGFQAKKLFGLELVSSPTPTPVPTPTPAPNPNPTRTVALKLETDANPTLTATYDLPDVNSNKALLFNRQTVIEGIPTAGYKGMPKDLDLNQREAHLRNLLHDWAWLPRQMVSNAGGKLYSHPALSTSNGDMSAFAGTWITRTGLDTATPQDWIETLVANVKSQW